MINEFTKLLKKDYAAIVVKQSMRPVEGDNCIIYPPTYAGNNSKSIYNIDKIQEGDKVVGNVCVIDSVGSQANRMEPLFKEEPYSELVPAIDVEVRDKKNQPVDSVSVFDAGHRIADAIVRFSDLNADIKSAFVAAGKGDALPLCKLAPTSAVFGCWDSRDSGVKIPRIVRSTIRACNVHELTRSATYFIPTDYSVTEAISAKEAKAAEETVATKPAKASTEGLANAIDTRNRGGVKLTDQSELLRESVLSLSALRRLKTDTSEATVKLQRYILGLAFVALTAPQDALLRMGCELTGDPENPMRMECVKHDGTREVMTLTHEDALAFARSAADAFGVGENRAACFDAKQAKAALDAAKKEK
jgi:CRISPR-associated protein Csb1